MSKLDLFHSQIIALYLKSRSDFYNFIKTCSKNKDAALSLKINTFPMIFADELRFPNIETQYIFDKNDNYLIYPNRKLKYVSTSKNIKTITPSSNKNKIDLNDKEFKNVKYCYISDICVNLLVSNQFDSLIYLQIYGKFSTKDIPHSITINLPFLKTLIFMYCNATDIVLDTPSLKFLDLKYFNSAKIITHDLITINSYDSGNIDCDFHYPFYYNGVLCENKEQYQSLIGLRFNYDWNKSRNIDYFKLNIIESNYYDFLNIRKYISNFIK